MPWIRVKLVNRPYYDPRTGNILDSINGRRNKKSDPFKGGGKVYPDHILKEYKILNKVEKGGDLWIEIDVDQKEIDAIAAKDTRIYFKASPSVVRSISSESFNAKVVADKDIPVIEEVD